MGGLSILWGTWEPLRNHACFYWKTLFSDIAIDIFLWHFIYKYVVVENKYTTFDSWFVLFVEWTFPLCSIEDTFYVHYYSSSIPAFSVENKRFSVGRHWAEGLKDILRFQLVLMRNNSYKLNWFYEHNVKDVNSGKILSKYTFTQ